MATRTKTYQECDFRLCRNRTGVEPLRMELRRTAVGSPHAPIIVSGELCPYHRDQLRNKILNMFSNKKKYDDPEPCLAPAE